MPIDDDVYDFDYIPSPDGDDEPLGNFYLPIDLAELRDLATADTPAYDPSLHPQDQGAHTDVPTEHDDEVIHLDNHDADDEAVETDEDETYSENGNDDEGAHPTIDEDEGAQQFSDEGDEGA